MLDTPKPPRRASPWEGPAPSVSNYMCEYSAAPRPRRIPFIMISTVSLSHSHTHQNHIHIVSISLSAGLIMGIKNRFSSAVTSPSVRLVFSRVRRVFVAAIVTINTGKVIGSLIFRNPESHAHHVFYFCHFCLPERGRDVVLPRSDLLNQTRARSHSFAYRATRSSVHS